MPTKATPLALCQGWHRCQQHIDALSAHLDKAEHQLTPNAYVRLAAERDDWRAQQDAIVAELAS